MKTYFLLTKVLLKSGLGSFNDQSKNKKRRRLSGIKGKLLYLFVFVCCLPFMFSLFMAGREGYLLMHTIEQEGVIVNLICIAGSLLTFIFGMAVVISVYYYTSDIEYLLPLPLKPYQIVAAKFTVTLLYEYLTVILFILPPLIGYGAAMHGGIVYWISMVLAILLLPIVPLIYASIVSMLIMLVFKKAKNRDFLTVTTSLVAIIAVLGINGLSSSFSSMTQQDLARLLADGNNSLSGAVNILFPNLVLLENALIFQNIFNLLFFCITIVLFIAVFIFLAKILYFKGVIGMVQTSSKRKRISEEQSRKIVRKNNALKTYIFKELKLLVRTPIYFLNCVLISFVWPIIFLIPMVTSSISQGGGGFGEILDFIQSMAADVELVSTFCILTVVGISIFVSAINFGAGTSISREGKNVFFMKYIPMPYKQQIFAKVMSSVVINVITTTVYCLIAMLILRMPIFAIIVSTILSFLSCFIFGYLTIVVDLIRPKLTWENEQSAIKQNFNTVAEMLLSLIVGGILVVSGILAYTKLHLSIYVIGIAACIVFLALALLLHKLVLAFGDKKLRQLSV